MHCGKTCYQSIPIASFSCSQVEVALFALAKFNDCVNICVGKNDA